ncbi:hypothetical protein BHF69_05385 [Anaerostipes sp. 992a]|uniref:lipopolysaccharide biosynthesis protein n=1 Tax=Anaerostipes sp. 992a TaxID=1261637 RepID=UPI0009521876|nr:hypothetical protein [Anaerostipes sp. 992a]OLR62163.1 hypothetical protein BHF69_05385 [Anaerostipes sp. 992a]
MKRYTRTQYSIMNVFASFIGYGLNVLLSFICRIVFVRCLSEEYLGISSLFANIISVLSLSELGIGTAIVYALYKPIADNDKKKIASLMKFYGTAYKIVGIFIFSAGVICLPFLNLIIRETPNIPDSLQIIYLLYLFSTASSYFFSYRSSIITASQRNYVVLGISYAVVVIQDIIQIVILFVTKNFMAYLVIQVICTYVTNVLISRKARKDYPYIVEGKVEPLSKEECWRLFKDIKALTVSKLSGILVNNTDNIVITYFRGLITTGAASNYTLLSATLAALVNQVFGSMTASIGNINAIETDERKYFYFKTINMANFWIYGWCAIGIALVSSDIVSLCFGNRYVLSTEIPLILAVNFYMVGMQNAVWTYKTTLGLFKYGQYILLVTAALNIIGDIFLGAKWGLLGIFAATAISRALTNCWYEPYAVFKYGLHMNPIQYFWSYLKYLIITCFAGGISAVICSYIVFFPMINVVVKLIVCSLIPNMIFVFCFYRTKEYQYIFGKVRKFMIDIKVKLLY